MYKYIFQFTPIGPYFFGAENKRKSNYKEKDDTANYYLKSFAFPQQSTILGAIRFFFLQNISSKSVFDNNHIADKEQATKDIGSKSFDIQESDFQFGKIKSISEVFLRNTASNYLPLPFDKWESSFGELTNVAGTNYYHIPKYDAKNYYNIRFTNGTRNVNFNDLFKEHIQSGNNKNNQGDDDEDGFYKQQYYRLDEAWSFAVVLETDIDLSHLYIENLFLNIGGENKIFKINIANSDFDRDTILKDYKHKNLTKLIITSDTFIKDKIKKTDYKYAIINTKPFRYLASSIKNTTQYQNRSNNNRSMVASNLFELIERGSTFYFESNEKATEFSKKYIIDNYLQKAGMNQFVILTN